MRAWTVVLVLTACVLLVGASDTVFAADATREDVASAMKLPESAADHAAMAKTYDDKAVEWKKEADYHKKMAAAYKASHLDAKDVATMQKHCSKIAKDAEDMSQQAKMMADYHRLRAKDSK